jgi:hypothetical protein
MLGWEQSRTRRYGNGKVSSWNKKVEELDSMRVIPPKVDIEKREYTVYRW